MIIRLKVLKSLARKKTWLTSYFVKVMLKLNKKYRRISNKIGLKIKKKSSSSFLLILGTCSFLIFPFSLNISHNSLKALPYKDLDKKSFVAGAVAKSGPAVVTIETQRTVVSRNFSNLPPGIFLDPELERFFGLERGRTTRSRIEHNQGSGVIFSPDGLILTNSHVVAKTNRLVVGLSNGRRVKGKVVGQDPLTDLAVIQLEENGPWPSALLGDSDKVVVGDWAIAVGNPFGLENTVTLGIISNLNRNVSQLGISGVRLNLIQTDAAINPGNSGGPLLNANGEVIGINTLIRSGPGAGLGFAIPINRAKEIANQLVKFGQASHPIIGISLGERLYENLQGKDLSNTGAIVKFVLPNSPAQKGGLKVGDIIRLVGKRKIIQPKDVITEINRNGIGRPLKFTVKRGDSRFILLISPIDIRQINRL